MISSQTTCPCGSKQTYGNCCEPFHGGKSFPDTAEKLMRSRYAAYVAGKIDYIDETNDPREDGEFDREAAEAWSKKSKWMGLEIVATRDGKPSDETGEVEFKATYEADGKVTVHHEVSLFKKFQKPGESSKRWLYSDGKEILEPIKRSEPKVGRNDPCACGSGKKAKKCCAA